MFTGCTLLFLVSVIVPCEDDVAAIAGFSVSYAAFLGLVVFAAILRPDRVIRAGSHPVFVCCYVFLLSALIIEWCHPMSQYRELIRIGCVVAAGIGIAALTTQVRSVRAVLAGLAVGGFIASLQLLTGGYSAMQQTAAEGFAEASAARAQIEAATDSAANLNRLAAMCGLAAAVWLVHALKSQRRLHGLIALIIGCVCFMGSFVPMSRSGLVITFGMVGSILYASHVRFRRLLVAVALLLLLTSVLVPEVFWERMTLDASPYESGDSCVRLYLASFDALPQCISGGVGNGRFWAMWGSNHGFRGAGAHNSFLHVAICWGGVVLAALVAIVWQAQRCCRRLGRRDADTLGLMALCICSLGLLLVSHNLYAKHFALALGLLVGGEKWVWPMPVSASLSQLRRPAFPVTPSG